jgi:hypothetical protein
LDQQYNSLNLNYYWPLDDDHQLDKKSFIYHLNQRKLQQEQGLFVQRSSRTDSVSTSNKYNTNYIKKWKKTHLDFISINFRKQTLLNYQKRVESGVIHSNMSQLTKRVPRAPSLPTTTGLGRGGGIPTSNSEWQTVGAKRFEKKLGDVFEIKSEKYLPKQMPIDTIPINMTEDTTELLLPLVIKIKRPKKSECQLNNSRIVAAVLEAMKNVFHDTYLTPTDTKITDRTIITPLKVPPHPTTLDQYITYEPNMSEGSMMGRIYVKTNNRLIEYKRDIQFCKFLAREYMVVEEIRLKSINPETVGYFEEMVPDPDILSYHTKLLRKYLPPKHPRFQLFTTSLYDSKRRSTRVVMVKCDPENFITLQSMFNNLDEQKITKFFAWKEFMSMSVQVRDVAFQKQVRFNKTYRSVTIKGFKDNEDNVPMIYKFPLTGSIEQQEDQKDPLESVYVTDYLQDWITAGNGSNLFHHVYEPIDGKRNTIVHVDNLAEAADYANIALSELARVMNAPAKTMDIENLKEAEEGTKKPAWQPYTKAAKLMEDKNNMQYYNNKRTRTD